MKILYIGVFSGTNIGDLVISHNIFRYLKNKHPLVECFDYVNLRKVNCIGTNISPEIYNRDRIIYKVSKNLYKNDIIRIIYHKFFEMMLSNENCNLYNEYKKIISNYDIVCIGGGNLLMSVLHNRWAIKLNTLVKIAKMADKKIFIISVGAGPILLERSKKIFEETLKKVDCITVRDEYSMHIIKDELNINKKILISGDPALLLDSDNSIIIKNNITKNIAISIMPFGKKNFANLSHYKDHRYYLDMYRDMIEYIYIRDSRCIFYLFSTEWTDYETIFQLYNHIVNNSKLTETNIKIEYIKSLNDLLNFYKKQDLLIGTRMHSLIIGYTQLLPIIGISWQKKVESFMTLVNLSKYCYQLNEVNLESLYINVQKLLKYGQNNENKLLNMKKLYNNVNSYCLKILEEI